MTSSYAKRSIPCLVQLANNTIDLHRAYHSYHSKLLKKVGSQLTHKALRE